MSGEELLPAKVQKMLDDLPPQAREALLLAIEKARERGRADAIYQMLGQQADAMSAPIEPFRMPEPSRLFFNPLERFLIDEQPPYKTSGRIWRGALQPIWLWIENHVTPDILNRCRARLKELDGKISSENDSALQAVELDLRKALLPQLDDQLARARQTPETRRRFSHYLGGDYQVQELEDVCVLLKYKDIVESCNRSLPKFLSHTSPNDVAMVAKLLTKLAGVEPRLPYYAGVLLQQKIEQAPQLPLWATACAGSDDLRVVASSPYAALIDLALNDAARMAELCINDLTRPSENNRAGAYMRQYAIACRNLRAAVDFESQTSTWLKRLSETRQRLSAQLEQELGSLFQLLRRNVRPLRAFGKQAPHPPDEFDLSRLCFLISVLDTVRGNADEFALNELVNRLYGECDGYLQLAVDSLLDELRTNFTDKRRMIFSYAEAAVRVGRAWHGDDYANVLKRGFDTAATTPEKKPENKASA